MENFHPLVVHFPIALMLFAAVMDIAALLFRREEWHTVAKWNLLAATIFGLAAIGTGLLAEEEIPSSGIKHEIAERHELFAFGFVGLATLLTAWRWWAGGGFPRRWKWGHLAGLLLCAGLVGVTGHLGGKLVFEHGVGTNLRLTPPPAVKETPAEKPLPKEPESPSQQKCMVMPEEDIDPNISSVYNGKTYYFCCRKCVRKFEADPEFYLTPDRQE
ncbi:MAG: hypothetical protein A2Z34_04805 [Planctomycetes bacterium RBG_16_59_8]|nr:MAG: hypothetical protein A2Z34_04805 [Planctomycetes bacterium RBG_16_59_8]